MTLPERLAHLPDRKRRELERVAAILFDEFDDALKTKLSMKGKRGRILKLILFGSYARGDWVEIARAAIAPTMTCSSSSTTTALRSNIKGAEQGLFKILR